MDWADLTNRLLWKTVCTGACLSTLRRARRTLRRARNSGSLWQARDKEGEGQVRGTASYEAQRPDSHQREQSFPPEVP
eukprot:3053595-Rhodomonas_salina.1